MGGVVRMILDKAKDVSRIPVYTSGCITKGRAGEELAGIDGMLSLGVKMLTDDGDAVPDLIVFVATTPGRAAASPSIARMTAFCPDSSSLARYSVSSLKFLCTERIVSSYFTSAFWK